MAPQSVFEAAILDVPDSTVQPNVTLDGFFPPRFMRAHTEFRTFEEFRERYPAEFEDRSDLEAISRDRLDRFVVRVTTFDSWREMRNQAAEREIRERFLI